jgi:hypothetical protein
VFPVSQFHRQSEVLVVRSTIIVCLHQHLDFLELVKNFSFLNWKLVSTHSFSLDGYKIGEGAAQAFASKAIFILFLSSVRSNDFIT